MIEKGIEAPVLAATENPQELEKQLTSLIFEGASLCPSTTSKANCAAHFCARC